MQPKFSKTLSWAVLVLFDGMLYNSLHHEELVAFWVLLVLPLHGLIYPHLQLLHVLRSLLVLLETVETCTRVRLVGPCSLFQRCRLRVPLQVQVELQIKEVIRILIILPFSVGLTASLVAAVIRLTTVVSQSGQRHVRFLETVL